MFNKTICDSIMYKNKIDTLSHQYKSSIIQKRYQHAYRIIKKIEENLVSWYTLCNLLIYLTMFMSINMKDYQAYSWK